jgi:hypothetical protein
MELKDHVARLIAHESIFDQDMMTGSLQLSMDVAKKHGEYRVLAYLLMMSVHSRTSAADTTVYDEALKPLLLHVFEECPDTRAVFRSLLEIEYPQLVEVLIPPESAPPPATEDIIHGFHFPHAPQG